jgi:hypothetical protein
VQALLFGAGNIGRISCQLLTENKDIEIIGFVDNNIDISIYCGKPVYNTQNISTLNFDKLAIALGSSEQRVIVREKLKFLGIPENKICYVFELPGMAHLKFDNDARCNWVEQFAMFLTEKNIHGSVAECGVNKGDFAKIINKVFPQSKLYLFDLFQEGTFSSDDLTAEENISGGKKLNIYYDFTKTSPELVLSKMPYPDNVVIRKGYFPDTAVGIDDKFVFVNIDMDLYKPTIDALKFFYDKIIPGGAILIHDYFDRTEFENIQKAVSDFETEIGKRLNLSVIGDYTSICIIK